jgi:RNA polymerase sigma-70 factor, ECF subfamily
VSQPIRAISQDEQRARATDAAALVAGVRAGDERAFDTLVGTYGNALVRYATAFLGAPDDADDVVQAVFVRLWQARANWRVTVSVWAYLLGAVRNEALNRERGRRSSLRGAAAAGRDLDIRRDAFAVVDPIADRADLKAGLGTLSVRRREAVVLRYGFGMTAAEAAAVMGATPKAVELLAVRGLRALRDWFGRR